MSKLVLAVLSDIHFSESSTHPIPARANAIASAIASAENQPSAIVLLLAGDIADKGLSAEYVIAEKFCDSLRKALAQRFSGIEVYFLCVPGNHDLEHPEGSEGYRKGVVEGGSSTMSNPGANAFYLEKLLEPQRNYWEFAKRLDLRLDGNYPQICSFFCVKVGSSEVHFNLLNSAILSQKTESQGSLVLPNSLISDLLAAKDGPHLTLTLMHHPTYWLQHQALTELRDLLALRCDYVITGHEHFSSGYEVKNDFGQSIRYYESPALFDPRKPMNSAFRVLVLDLDASLDTPREKQLIFEWKGSIYRPKSSPDLSPAWRDIETARIASKSLRMNSTAYETLNDPGIASPRQREREARLSDLFEYPDLKLRKDLREKQIKIVKGSQVLSFLTEGGIKELHGAPLSGKTALSKTLALEIRARGVAFPIWLDGKQIVCKSIDEFEKILRRSVKNLYSAEQVEDYWQLLPEKRSVIIDNWHIAGMPSDLRPKVYEWLSAFASSAILLVDQTFQIRELISSSKLTEAVSDKALQGITQLEIGGLSHVSLARLIHRYLRLRGVSEDDVPEESREAKKLETVLSQLLGRNRLPAYAFFVLCILQALENKKTDAISGGSLGTLYELLILEALARESPEDREIPKKIVFLQEIAFYMWSNRVLSVSPSEIKSIISKYTETSYMTLPTDRYLDELEKAKIIEENSGNYGFCYEQYFHYFVARFIRSNIDGKNGDELRRAVDKMIDEISSPENSNIVMFLIHFDKEKERIIDRLTSNAARIYSSLSPARLEDDAQEFSIFSATPPLIEVEDSPDVAKNREALRVSRDAREERRMLDANRELEIVALRAYPYSEDLPEHCKLHMVAQSMYALGQVIRNFSPNLPGEKNVEVLKQTYLLALRALSRVMGLCKGVIMNFKGIQMTGNADASILEVKRLTEELFVLLPQLYAAQICSSVSEYVGIADMDRAYIETMQEIGGSVAVRMIDLTVKMDHFAGFPEREIRELYAEIKSNTFSATILRILVVGYIMLHKLDTGTRDRTIISLGLKPRSLAAPKE